LLDPFDQTRDFSQIQKTNSQNPYRTQGRELRTGVELGDTGPNDCHGGLCVRAAASTSKCPILITLGEHDWLERIM
jgi:hypothetical protein